MWSGPSNHSLEARNISWELTSACPVSRGRSSRASRQSKSSLKSHISPPPEFRFVLRQTSLRLQGNFLQSLTVAMACFDYAVAYLTIEIRWQKRYYIIIFETKCTKFCNLMFRNCCKFSMGFCCFSLHTHESKSIIACKVYVIGSCLYTGPLPEDHRKVWLSSSSLGPLHYPKWWLSASYLKLRDIQVLWPFAFNFMK